MSAFTKREREIFNVHWRLIAICETGPSPWWQSSLASLNFMTLMFWCDNQGNRERAKREKFYYNLQRSHMTDDTKIITFHVLLVKVSSDSRCSRTLLINFAIKNAHCDCERNLCNDWIWSKMCGKHSRVGSKASFIEESSERERENSIVVSL